MRMMKNITLVFFLSGLLSACVSNNQQVTTAPEADVLPNVQDRVVVNGEVLPLPEDRSIATYTLPDERPVSSVVKNLTRRAQDQTREGNYDGAANSLERALRIEPRNPMLWNRLADVRYLQKAWRKSIQLAAKSNTLAANNKSLRRENWYLMSNAYKALGDIESEQKYREKLKQQVLPPL